MLNNLADEIIVKTKDGQFKLLKNGQLTDLAEDKKDDLIVPQDDLIKVEGKQELIKANMPKKPTADFYFDVSDENEVRKISQGDERDKNKAIKEFIEAKVEEIIRQAGLSQTARQSQQLKNIVISRLRNVRSVAQTKEALQTLSGIDQSQEPVDWQDIIIKLIEKEKAQVDEVIRTGQIPKIATAKENLNKPKEVNGQEALKNILESTSKAKPIEIKKTGSRASKSQPVVPTKQTVMGSVDEIRAISLEDFRKLSADASEAADKILQKINFLEDESIIKKAQGIKAWRESELYQIYLKIGRLSMAQKKPIEQIIRELEAAGEPCLTPIEFNAIADLNTKLSY